MRVLLLNPPSRLPVLRDYYCSSVSKAGYLWHPIDLLAQSGRLSAKHDLRVLDAPAAKFSESATARFIENFAPQAVFALTSAGTWRGDFGFIEPLKRRIGFVLAMSGEIFLGDAGKILEAHPWIDAALLNFTGPDLERFLEGSTSDVTNLAWRDGDKVFVRREGATGTFTLGLPRHDLFPMERYHMPWHLYHPFATVMTDYGCPFGCSFCNSRTFGHARRDLDDLSEELEWLHRRGIRQLFIKDMTFASSRPHAVRVLETMIEKGREFRWNAYCRADLIDDDLALLMSRAGCHLVQIGVESADEALLNRHGKKIKTETVRKAFKILKKAGISAGAHFILGLPGDSLDGIRRTVELAVELDPAYASFNLAMPRLGASLNDAGWMDRPLDSSGSEPFYELDDLSPRTLVRERDRAMRRFYLRPGYWIKTALAIKTPYQLWNLLRQARGILTGRRRS